MSKQEELSRVLGDYQCRKCGSTNITVKVRGTNTGIYCADCGAWIEYISFDLMREYYKDFNRIESTRAFKRCKRYNGNKIITCSNCNTQLYHSAEPMPIGQFNLLDAKYCPVCGLEFLF